MIICVYEINMRRHLVGLFDSVEALHEKYGGACTIKEVPKERWPTEGYVSKPVDYNATRMWQVERLSYDPVDDYSNNVDPLDVWPFGYDADPNITAYEVDEAPNCALDWDED